MRRIGHEYVTHICEQCQTTFVRILDRYKRRRFCSTACRYAEQRQPYLSRIAKRLNEFTDPETCWLWTRTINANGYGELADTKPSRRKIMAHRATWELLHGPIPEGLCVLHRCDTPACVNPAHLFAGTVADNNADMVSKGRQQRGERSGKAKLTNADVLAIRAATGTQQAIGERFGVTQSTVSVIRHRKHWAHLA